MSIYGGSEGSDLPRDNQSMPTRHRVKMSSRRSATPRTPRVKAFKYLEPTRIFNQEEDGNVDEEDDGHEDGKKVRTIFTASAAARKKKQADSKQSVSSDQQPDKPSTNATAETAASNNESPKKSPTSSSTNTGNLNTFSRHLIMIYNTCIRLWWSWFFYFAA